MDEIPGGLRAGGAGLWRAVTEAHELDAVQRVQLLEACRQKDRLDQLDAVLRGDVETWSEIDFDKSGERLLLVVDDALMKANSTANQMKQLLAALRLPDEAGKRPQQRGGARGSYTPGGKDETTAAKKARARWGA